MIPQPRCQWCYGVTGSALSCTCRTVCGRTRCPVDPDPYQLWYGYQEVPVPQFREEEEVTESD